MDNNPIGPRICATVLAIGLMLPSLVVAHPGGLNAEGCHHNRKTGGYHCHRAPAPPPPPAKAASQQAEAPAQPASSAYRSAAAPICHTGPRGGRYTITSSGKKNYHGC